MRKDLERLMGNIVVKCENKWCGYEGTIKCMRGHSMECFEELQKVEIKLERRVEKNESGNVENKTTFFDMDFFNPLAFSSGLCLTNEQDPFIQTDRGI